MFALLHSSRRIALSTQAPLGLRPFSSPPFPPPRPPPSTLPDADLEEEVAKRKLAVFTNKQIVGARGDAESLLSIVEANIGTFNEINTATLMSQLRQLPRQTIAKVKRDRRYFDLIQRLPAVMEEGGVAVVAITCHALVKLDERDTADAALSYAELRADTLLEEATPQNVANLAWSMARRGWRATDSPRFVKGVEARAESLVKEGSTQEVANTAWAFAKMKADAPGLFWEIDKRADWLVKNGHPQHIANTAWAFGVLGEKGTKLFKTIDERAGWLVSKGK